MNKFKTWFNTTFKPWFDKRKVVFFGTIMAIGMPASDLISNGTVSTIVLVYSAIIGGATYLSRNLHGQWATIMGMLSTVFTTMLTHHSSGVKTTWWQIVIQVFVLYFAAIAPAPKKIDGDKSD